MEVAGRLKLLNVATYQPEGDKQESDTSYHSYNPFFPISSPGTRGSDLAGVMQMLHLCKLGLLFSFAYGLF